MVEEETACIYIKTIHIHRQKNKFRNIHQDLAANGTVSLPFGHPCFISGVSLRFEARVNQNLVASLLFLSILSLHSTYFVLFYSGTAYTVTVRQCCIIRKRSIYAKPRTWEFYTLPFFDIAATTCPRNQDFVYQSRRPQRTSFFFLITSPFAALRKARKRAGR